MPDDYITRRNQLAKSVAALVPAHEPTTEELAILRQELYADFSDISTQEIDLAISEFLSLRAAVTGTPRLSQEISDAVETIHLLTPDIPQQVATRIARVGAEYNGEGSNPFELDELIRYTTPYRDPDDIDSTVSQISSIFPQTSKSDIKYAVNREATIIKEMAHQITSTVPGMEPDRAIDLSRTVYAESFLASHVQPNEPFSTLRRNALDRTLEEESIREAREFVRDRILEEGHSPGSIMGIPVDLRRQIGEEIFLRYPALPGDTADRVVFEVATNEPYNQAAENFAGLRFQDDPNATPESIVEDVRRAFPNIPEERATDIVGEVYASRAHPPTPSDDSFAMEEFAWSQLPHTRREFTTDVHDEIVRAIRDEFPDATEADAVAAVGRALSQIPETPPPEFAEIPPPASYKDVRYVIYDSWVKDDVEQVTMHLHDLRADEGSGAVKWNERNGLAFAEEAMDGVRVAGREVIGRGKVYQRGDPEWVPPPGEPHYKCIVAFEPNGHIIGATGYDIVERSEGNWRVHGSYIGTTGKTLGVGTNIIHETMKDPDVVAAMKKGASFEVFPANEKVANFYEALGFIRHGSEFPAHRAQAFAHRPVDNILAERLHQIGLPDDVDADVAAALEKYTASVGQEVEKAKGEGFIVGFTDGMNRGNKELGVPRVDFGISFNVVREEALQYIEKNQAVMRDQGGTAIGGEFHPWMESMPINMRNSIFQSLYLGVADGKSMDKIADEIQSIMGNQKWQAMRIARTEVAAAQFEGMKQEYSDAGFTKVKWLLGDNPCEVCDEYGKPGQNIYDLDKCPTIPVHPNCRCDIAPIDETTGKIDTVTAELIKKAQENEKIISPDVVDSIKSSSGDMAGFEHRLKSKDSTYTKVLRRYVEALRANPDELPDISKIRDSIDDTVRYTAIFKSDDYANGINRTFNALVDKGYTPDEKRIKNAWVSAANGGDGNERGYKGVNTIWRTPDGYEFELQFHTPESFKAKDQDTHALYKELQTTSDPEKIAELTKKINGYFDMPNPPGIETWAFRRDFKQPVSFTHDDWIKQSNDTETRVATYKEKVGRVRSLPLTSAQDNSIEDYTANGYKNINKYLREGRLDWPEGGSLAKAHLARIEENIKNIDAAIKDHGKKLPEGYDLWRGLGRNYAVEVSRMKPGDVIQDKAYTSLSYDTSTAEYFAKERDIQDFEVNELVSSGKFSKTQLEPYEKDVLVLGRGMVEKAAPVRVDTFIRVVEPENLRGIYVGVQEGEIIVQRGQKFQIVDKSWIVPTEEPRAIETDASGVQHIRRLREVITVRPVR